MARDVRFNEQEFPFKSSSLNTCEILEVDPLVIPETQEKEGEIRQAVAEAQSNVQPGVLDAEENVNSSVGVDVSSETDTQNEMSEKSDCESSNSEADTTALSPQLNRGNSQNETTPRTSGRECRKPGWFKNFISSYEAFSAVNRSPQVPETYDDIFEHANQATWLEAVKEELRALNKNHTWEIVKPPPLIIPIPCKWVFNLKTDADGKPIRYKARLVAKGYVQRRNVDYDETFAPVAKLNTIRTVLAIANTRGMEVHQMDVRTAFLNGELEEKVYMQVPDGVEAKTGDVCLLKRALYGLKQSPRCWNTRFNKFLQDQGFIRSRYDYCLYVKHQKEGTAYIIVYVDDLLIVAQKQQTVLAIKEVLKREFDMADMNELHDFLGIKIKRDRQRGIIRLSQKGLIEKILYRFGMSDCKPCKTPAETKLQLKRSNDRCVHPYRELIGCLMYLMMGTRPDLCFIVGYLSRFQDAANTEHWNQAKRVLRYVQGTRNVELVYRCSQNNVPITGFVDADYANDVEDRKSISGFLLKVFGCIVAWSSKKQTAVAISSTEAEYVAMSSCVSESIWLSGLMGDLGEVKLMYPIPVFEDNQAAIAMA